MSIFAAELMSKGCSHLSAPGLILDANVALDLWVFADAACAVLKAAMGGVVVRCVASPLTRQELARVVKADLCAVWGTTPAQVLHAYDGACEFVADPAPQSVPLTRCTDPDDQPYIDLALAEGVQWLLTRDRAVLRVGRRLRRHGVQLIICTPQQFAAAWLAR